MSDIPEWLGQPEGQRLEYKSGKAPRIESIAREAVAMLNAEGGLIVVGVDDNGSPDGVDDPASWAGRLRQGLMDRIVPRPLDLITVESRRAASKDVLEVNVLAAADRLHAERRSGLLGFWLRIADTVLPLSLEEVRERMSGAAGPPDATASASRQLAADLVAREPEGGIGFSLAFRPRVETRLDNSVRRELVTRWQDAPASDSARRDGFGLDLEPRYARIANSDGRLVVDIAEGYHGLELDERGQLEVRFGATKVDRGLLLGRADGAVNTWTLVEGAATSCRFAAMVYRSAPPTVVDWAAALHLKPGMKVRPALPDTIGWRARWSREYVASAGSVACHGHFASGQLIENPDAAALQVLLGLWERFDFEGPVPLWSESTMRFEFPVR